MTIPGGTKEKIAGHISSLHKNKKFLWIAVIILAIAGYFGFQLTKGNENITRYTLESVSKGNLIVSITGSGQVGVSSQVDVKPKVSGEVTYINVINGQEVKAGAVIAKIDSKDAAKTVRNASLALQNAQLSLQKVKKPSDDYTISSARSSLEQAKIDLKKLQDPPTDYDLLMAQNAVTQAQRNLDQAKDNLTKVNLSTSQNLQKAFDDGYSAVSQSYLDIPQLIKDAFSVQWNDDKTAISQNNISSYELVMGKNSPLISAMVDDYNNANQLYLASFDYFKTVQRTSDQDTLYKLINDTYKSAKAVSQALESARNLLDKFVTYDYKQYYIASIIDSIKAKIETDIPIINKDVTALQTAKDTIDTTNQNSPLDVKAAQASISAAEDQLSEKQSALKKLQDGATAEDIALAREKVKQQQDSLDNVLAGSDTLDIRAQELNVKDKQNALYDANQTFADYTVTAPFDCIVAKVNINKGDTISSGTSIATVITKQEIAELSLNEVDAAKIKVGQKATMTFDAIDSLTITGHVAEIDTLGTVTQGVVTYTVKIAFDTQDGRIKPGMSTSAAIITDMAQDVILAPNGAIKTNSTSYVEMIENPITNAQNPNDTTVTSLTAPKQVDVVTGLINDTYTEITSGLNEGDKIVTKTTNGKSSTTTTSTAAGGRSPGIGSILGGGRG